ncbi:MAG TPA: hypothetical protein VNT22_08670 [Baekduia sp.]|nr:hypothetical protein [Baekduia sp.]
MAGRVAGWLLVCDPPQQTAAEIAEALQASRGAVGTAVTMLDSWGIIHRSRPPGERSERIAIDPAFAMFGQVSEHEALARLARQGLNALSDTPRTRQARLFELVTRAEFLVERLPQLIAELEAHSAVRVSADLPDTK